VALWSQTVTHSPPLSAIDQLRRQLEQFSRPSPRRPSGPGLATGLGAVDRHLPGHGLARGALHELTGDMAGITGFLATLLGRADSVTEILWISPAPRLYAPGLSQLGLAHDRLTIIHAPRADDRLWAAEEALRELGRGAVMVEVEHPDLTDTRRLLLAAEKSGGTGFLIRRDRQPSAALTRWQVEPAPGRGQRPCLRLMLERCRGGQPGSWVMEWNHATLSFSLAAALGHGSLAAAE